MLDLLALKELLASHGQDASATVPGFDIGGRPFDFARRRALVGVINLSPESWYRESICTTPAQAIARGRLLAAQGADIVDIGAESTLPEAPRVSPAEQLARLRPVVKALSAEGILVSVESYYPEVLEGAARAGAAVFNLTGAQAQEDVLALAARFNVAVILCYVQGETVREVSDFSFYDDMQGEMEAHFRERTAQAAAAGVRRCIIDPGLGFYYANLQDGALRVNHQLHTFLHTFRLRRLGFPTMNILPHAQDFFGDEHRRAAEPFFAVLAMLGGTDFIRTHEVDQVARIRAVMEAYRR